MGNNITIQNTNIRPGSRQVIEIPMPQLYNSTPLSMPVHVINGKKSGPTVCITAAIHGDELIGVEIIRRLLKKSCLKQIQGSLIVVPVVNMYGFVYMNRYLMDRRDLNRCFPGSQRGSLASRLAYLLTQELISKATHCIDLHSGSLHRSNLPQIRADLDMPGIKSLAKAFNVPVILHSTKRDGSLREYADKQGIPLLLYEAGESLRFDDFAIKTGVNGILSVLKKLKMLDLKPKSIKTITPTIARESYWIRAPKSGIMRIIRGLGKKVKEGDTLAVIADPTGKQEYKLKSWVSGVIIGISNIPLVHEGAALFHIASIKKPSHVLEQIEDLQDFYDDSRIFD